MSVQDRCMVCTKHTIGPEIILDAPMVLIGDEAHVHARFGLFRDSTSLDARYVRGLRRTYIGSEIVLDAPDGSSR